MKKKTQKKVFSYPETISIRVNYYPPVAKKLLRGLKKFKKKIFDVNRRFINTKEMGIWLTNDGEWSEWELLEEAVICFEEYLNCMLNFPKGKNKHKEIALHE